MKETIGVLLMAYGSPKSLDGLVRYYTHIRNGIVPSAAEIERLKERYMKIGGRSPLHEITFKEAELLAARLNAGGTSGYRVYVGMKHCTPFIEDAVKRMADDGITRAVALVLAPHYSGMSVGAYFRRVSEKNACNGQKIRIRYVESWHTDDKFIEAVSMNIAKATKELDGGKKMVIFSAHSLPSGIRDNGDPYEAQLNETCSRVAGRLHIDEWRLAYQSAPATAENWLGPDIKDVMLDAADSGYKDILVCPIGFVSDHLEILHDIDIECKSLASSIGVKLVRAASLNTDPLFIDALAGIVRQALAGPD
ncbi:MAG: ferrochelatase [Candidatus Micrarchaeota archaeon]|nr:ferrochelatase [Candidatus Micrarchaeota archaeon]